MTHFLEVGSMREDLHEIHASAQHLRRLLVMTPDQRASLEQARIQQGDLTTHTDDVRFALATILTRSEDLVDLLDQFESDPIIFTGAGSTTSVLAMLERLLNEKRSG
jgi:hypothetical protein